MLVVVVGLALTAAAASAAPTAVPTKKPGVLTVGFDVPAPGFWNGRVTGTTIKNPTGFEAQLAQAIAKYLGLSQVVFIRAPFGGLFSPSSKPYDFAMEEATITAQRAKVVSFSAPYFDANQGVLIRKGLTKPTSVAALKSHPEFRQKAKVHAHVIGPGTMLVSVSEEATSEDETDPVMAAFLSFLSRDISQTPDRIKPLSATRIQEARKLTKGVKVRDDEPIPDPFSREHNRSGRVLAAL